MKTLTLLRHAKSDWTDAGLTDFDRPLAQRGLKAAPLMGRHLRAKKLSPDLVLCSAAARAKQTWELVAPELQDPPEPRYLKSLYLASPSRMLAAVTRAPSEVEHLMLIAHNPGMENLAQRLIGGGKKSALKQLQAKFPTAAIAVIRFEADAWDEIKDGSGELTHFTRPKDLV
ncbi:MAG: histidine phosphatase family protein [Rhodovibrionaceae bacterium]|nr:histidine phosphatase family protein [Rhodovibrionaceae bacterium]